MELDIDEINPWGKEGINTCRYCGKELPTSDVQYCSDECSKQDAIWVFGD